MKKLLPFLLALIFVFGLTVTTMGSPGFKSGHVTEITKSNYDAASAKEFAANNSSVEIPGLGIFYSDNKNLNTWYLDVTENVEGTIDIAYRIGSKYFNSKFTITGPGLYSVGDSKGSNGINAVKIGSFQKKAVTNETGSASGPMNTEQDKSTHETVTTYQVVSGWNGNLQNKDNSGGFKFSVNKLENGVIVDSVVHNEKINAQQKGNRTLDYGDYRVRIEWNDNNKVTSVTIVS